MVAAFFSWFFRKSTGIRRPGQRPIGPATSRNYKLPNELPLRRFTPAALPPNHSSCPPQTKQVQSKYRRENAGADTGPFRYSRGEPGP